MPNSRFALHSLAPHQFTVCAPFLPLIHGLCAFFKVLLTPLWTAPSPPPSQFTVCTSRFVVCAPSKEVHPNVRQNLCHTISLWYLFCSKKLRVLKIPRTGRFENHQFSTFDTLLDAKDGYQNCWRTKIASFDSPQNLRF